MKITNGEASVVASGNVGESSGFRIEASAHAFRLLSSGLYSDKIGAVLREIGCNAADAHVFAGKRDVPFEVKLPTQLDPIFYIKDFGPGLSDEEVRELYTTYFSSSKQTSNDFTGAFGLGSKSPFSYTDSFTVTAVKDGSMRIYTAHLGDNGSPAITLMQELPAEDNWPSGVSVGFPVKPENFKEFRLKAERIFKYFSPMPVILGMERDLKAPKFAIERDSFMLKALDEGHHHPAAVIMGNVVYRLDWHRLGAEEVEVFKEASEAYYEKFKSAGEFLSLQYLFSRLTDLNFYLKLPIGSVQVTASREELEYDPQSRITLVEAMFKAAHELAQILRDAVDDETKSVWERRVALLSLLRYPEGGEILNSKQVRALWRFAGLSEEHIEYATEVIEAGPQWLHSGTVRVNYIAEATGRAKTAWSRTVKGGTLPSGTKPLLKVGPKSAIVIADQPYAAERVKAAVNSKKLETVILLQTGKANKMLLDTVLNGLLNHFGHPPVLKVSELDEQVTIVKRPSTPSSAPRAKQVAMESKLATVTYAIGAKKDQTESMALKDVPESCRYFMIEDNTRRDDYRWSAHPDAMGAYRMTHRTFRDLMDAIVNAVDNQVPGISGLPMEGYLLVRASEYKRLKLDELGFKPFIAELCAFLESDEVLKELKALMDAMPPRAFNTVAGRQLVTALQKGSDFGKIVKEQLAGTVLGETLNEEASGVKAEPTTEQVAAERVMHEVAHYFRGQKSRQILDEMQTKTNVDGLVASTLPAWHQLITNGSSYYFRNWVEGSKLDAPTAYVIRALLTPADAVKALEAAVLGSIAA